jgi:ATP-dependent Clp protease, protease subunit
MSKETTVVKIRDGQIYLYGDVTATTDSELADALQQFKGQPVTVRINSPGGYADVGLSAYSVLRRHSGRVTTVVDALAASAASVIALGGDVRLTSRTGRWMIHNANASVSGSARVLRTVADVLDYYDQALIEVYAQYMPKGTDIAAMLDRETYLTAQQAVSLGLSTGILETAATASVTRPVSNPITTTPPVRKARPSALYLKFSSR